MNPYLTKDQSRNILIIDDSRLNREIVKRTLSKLQMNVHEASDGLQGLALLRKERFDLVLVDIIMPNLDGFGFLEQFKKIVKNEFIPVILMTGLDESDKYKIQGMGSGADDLLRKPLNEDELIARVNSLLRLKSAYSELYIKNQIIEKELEWARRVQESIIPTDYALVDYPRISARYLPIADIGGDFIDYYVLPDDNVGILIADVTGHGIPAALVMAMSKMNFSIYSGLYLSPKELFEQVNARMRTLLIDSQYITAFYVVFNRKDNTIRYCCAGHTRPLYHRKQTDKILALNTNGLFLGITDDTNYEEKVLKVEKNDRLLLYTDGITEIKNEKNEEFGEERLARFIKNNPDLSGDAFTQALMDELAAFAPLEKRNDDIAVLHVEF